MSIKQQLIVFAIGMMAGAFVLLAVNNTFNTEQEPVLSVYEEGDNLYIYLDGEDLLMRKEAVRFISYTDGIVEVQPVIDYVYSNVEIDK